MKTINDVPQYAPVDT